MQIAAFLKLAVGPFIERGDKIGVHEEPAAVGGEGQDQPIRQLGQRIRARRRRRPAANLVPEQPEQADAPADICDDEVVAAADGRETRIEDLELEIVL